MTLFDKYSYKQKNTALLVLGVLLGAVAYKRSFSKTIEAWALIHDLEVQQMQARSSQNTIHSLQTEIGQMNRVIGKEDNSVEIVQQGFLNFFARKATNLSVNQIEEVYTFDHPDFSINTFRIDLKGNFNDQLRYIYQLENEFNEARLIYSKFENKKDSETQKQFLVSTLLLQNYVHGKN